MLNAVDQLHSVLSVVHLDTSESLPSRFLPLHLVIFCNLAQSKQLKELLITQTQFDVKIGSVVRYTINGLYQKISLGFTYCFSQGTVVFTTKRLFGVMADLRMGDVSCFSIFYIISWPLCESRRLDGAIAALETISADSEIDEGEAVSTFLLFKSFTKASFFSPSRAYKRQSVIYSRSGSSSSSR